jgi:hypothetical protein
VWFAAWPALGASGQEPPAPAAPARELNLAAEAPERLTVGVVWENDSDYYTFFDPEDADYTNGIRLDVAWTPEFADRWAAALPLSGPFKDMRSAVGVAVGQNMYSPDAITDPNPLPEEHPWGAWLYGGFYLQRADATKLDTLELDLGVTGEWAGGEYTQKSIHRLTQSPEPMGWKYQNSEEIGANLVLQRTWKYGCGEQDRWRAEVLPYAGATLGTIYANASAGATARVGWNMADDFGMPRIGHLGDQTALAAGGVGVYLFGRLGGRAVAHDTFLDGSLFQDDRSVDKEPLVGEAQLGVSLRVTRFFDLDYSQTWWTEEFKTEGRGQHFGSWGFRLHFEY